MNPKVTMKMQAEKSPLRPSHTSSYNLGYCTHLNVTPQSSPLPGSPQRLPHAVREALHLHTTDGEEQLCSSWPAHAASRLATACGCW